VKKGLIVFLVCLAFSQAHASWLTSSPYKMWLVPSMGGGWMGSGGYRLFDIKGQGYLGGPLPSGAYRLGAGGIYCLFDDADITIPGDTGIINGTWIERAGSDIVLTWSTTFPAGVAVNIWVQDAGPGGSLDVSPAASWTNTFSVPALTTSQLHTGAVRDGRNYYYAVVPGGTTRPNIFNRSLNNWLVGKADVTIAGSDNVPLYTLISAPFLQRTDDINNVIGPQLTPSLIPGQADQVLLWDGGWPKWMYYWSGSALIPPRFMPLYAGSSFANKLGQGMFVRVPPRPGQRDHNITLVGRILNEDYRSTLGTSLYTMIGNPFPNSVALDAVDRAGFRTSRGVQASDTPANADQIIYWGNRDWAKWMYLSSAGWREMFPGGATGFNLGNGYFFRRAGSLTGIDWRFTDPNPRAP